MTSQTKKCPHCNEEIQATALKCRFCQEWLVASAQNAQQGRFGDLYGQEIGPYHIIDRLGDGGMGSVWKGEHVALGRTVAVKVLHSHLLSYNEAVQRFLAEARGLVRLGSPYLVEILDLGSLPDGRPYFVMEYLEGINLEDWIAANKPVPISSVFSIGDQLLQAMTVVHAKNIVHRDLKPQNIMVLNRDDGSLHLKLLDFGIAKFVQDESSAKLTNPGMTVGTPLYMSPEQAGGVSQIDGRSDLYSIGILLYEAACGKPPFYHDNGLKVMEMHHKNAVPPPREQREDVPEALEKWLLKALTKKRALRFQTAEEAREALLACKAAPQIADQDFRDAETNTLQPPPAVPMQDLVSNQELTAPQLSAEEPKTNADVVLPVDVSSSDILEISAEDLEEEVEENQATLEEPPRPEEVSHAAANKKRRFLWFGISLSLGLLLLYLLLPSSTPEASNTVQPSASQELANQASPPIEVIRPSPPIEIIRPTDPVEASQPVALATSSQPSTPTVAPTPTPVEPKPLATTTKTTSKTSQPQPQPQPIKTTVKKGGPPGPEALLNPYKKRSP